MGPVDLAVLSGMAISVTKAVDWVRGRFDKAGHAPKDLWIALALAFGIAMAVGTGVNALAALSDIVVNGHHLHVNVWAGEILTGAGIGAWASGFHEGLDALSGAAKALHVSKTVAESKAGIVDDPGGGEPIAD